ncbi:Uncharacterised protein [Collinsella intestinalis]|nr:Uncharacterised protein [Collinsella intestinalis]
MSSFTGARSISRSTCARCAARISRPWPSRVSASGAPSSSAWDTAAANDPSARTPASCATRSRASSLEVTPTCQQNSAFSISWASSPDRPSQYRESDASKDRPALNPSLTMSVISATSPMPIPRLRGRSISRARARIFRNANPPTTRTWAQHARAISSAPSSDPNHAASPHNTPGPITAITASGVSATHISTNPANSINTLPLHPPLSK